MTRKKITKKRKSVSKKTSKRKGKTRKKSTVKKAVRQSRKTKKRGLKKRKRASKKPGIFLRIWNSSQEWMKGGIKKIRKEQRHCLRFKKYKGREFFCFFKALLSEYPWRTMSGFILIAIMGLSVITANIQQGEMGKYFGLNLQTGLISQLTTKISSLRNKISDRERCTKDEYWEDNTEDVCNYWLYTQANSHCAKFDVSTERVAIGTKMCCEGYGDLEGKVNACPGSDIFFSKSKMHTVGVIKDKSECGLGACEFYPKSGYHIKVDKDGNPILKNGMMQVEKNCVVSREEGPCSKECGGGKKKVTMMQLNCVPLETEELCNIQPCFAEIIVN